LLKNGYANDRTGAPLSLFKCKWNSATMEPSKNGYTDNASITPTIERVHRTVEEWMHRQHASEFLPITIFIHQWCDCWILFYIGIFFERILSSQAFTTIVFLVRLVQRSESAYDSLWTVIFGFRHKTYFVWED
jgi:hypothetical protein